MFMQAHHMGGNSENACPVSSMSSNAAMERMVLAQSLWDASMAWRLSETLKSGNVAKVLHVCGRFHVEHGLGTWKLILSNTSDHEISNEHYVCSNVWYAIML